MGLKRPSISSLPPHFGQHRTTLLEQTMRGSSQFLFWAYLLFCIYFVLSWQNMSIHAWQRNSQFRFSRYLPCLFEGFEGLWGCHGFLATGYSMWGVNEWVSVVRINFWWHILTHSKTHKQKLILGMGKKNEIYFRRKKWRKKKEGGEEEVSVEISTLTGAVQCIAVHQIIWVWW